MINISIAHPWKYYFSCITFAPRCESAVVKINIVNKDYVASLIYREVSLSTVFVLLSIPLKFLHIHREVLATSQFATVIQVMVLYGINKKNL